MPAQAGTLPLAVLGDFAWDVLIRPERELLPGGDSLGEVLLMPGGSAANVAVWAARCGLETAFIGKVGRDRFGKLAKENLLEEGVQAELVETSAHRTASVAVFSHPGGERSMVSGQGADFYLMPSELPLDLLTRARHLHLTAWSFFTDPPREAARLAARTAKAAGATLSLDPGSFQMIGEMGVEAFLEVTCNLGIDIFFPNLQEGQALTALDEPQAIAARLAELYRGALIMLKLDAKGALVYEEGHATAIAPGSDRLVDATGAGDAFAGAYLARAVAGADPVSAARLAVGVSSWVVSRIGARPAVDEHVLRVIGRAAVPKG